ncbi:MAG TPA: hypothetical protein DEF36_04660 [Desulfotomaculum sp.]|nr:hypothetical protein [Desulfotomaculum sp.]
MEFVVVMYYNGFKIRCNRGWLGMKADAVFEGGGVKGTGLAGALYYAEKEMKVEWQNVAGTSAGAIVAALVASGCSAAEIKDIVFGLDFSLVKDEGFLDHFSYPGKLLSIIFEKGIYEGNYIESFIGEQLRKKGVVTFGDLRIDGEKDPRYQYKLNVIASDITRGKMLVLPADIKDYGIDPDRLSVARAVRMSMSIPVYFEPVRLDYLNNGVASRSFIVDGGILSNFPVWLFDADFNPQWPTFGFRLIEPGQEKPRSINNIVDFLSAMIGTMMEAHDERYIKEANFNRTIPIPTMGVRTTEFEITSEKKEMLFQAGYRAAQKFFEDYTEETYRKIHPLFKKSVT